MMPSILWKIYAVAIWLSLLIEWASGNELAQVEKTNWILVAIASLILSRVIEISERKDG